MPHSIDPEPAEDETECGRCGAHFYIGLNRCPNCGANLYEPEEEADQDEPKKFQAPKKSLRERLDELFRRITKKPYTVDELFGAALNEAELFTDLVDKVRGDRATAERLVEYERQKLPQGNRFKWIQNAIQRWERDNKVDRNS
jgi:predicted  nucleic acid-binding Zn-ribbon protein